MNHNNDIEKFLYELIFELSKEKAPIVFKGGLALKNLLQLSNKEINVDRRTIDIDGNWIENYDKESITNIIDKALKKIEPSYYLECTREALENQSLGYKVCDANGDVVTKIDLDIKDNPFFITININDIIIKYSSLDKIMADKISVLSGEHLFRRVKDILDIYLIINNSVVNKDRVDEVLEFDNRILGNFELFLTKEKELKHAYDLLIGIENKPDFDLVYANVKEYLKKEKYI